MELHGSNINLAALSEVKSLADLKKLEIYSHLENKDQANEDLWNVLHPGKKAKEPSKEEV